MNVMFRVLGYIDKEGEQAIMINGRSNAPYSTCYTPSDSSSRVFQIS